MLAPILLGGRSRKLILIRFGFLGVLLVVTFVFHVSGTALVELQIARLVLLVALVVGFALISRRRRRTRPRAARPTPRHSSRQRPATTLSQPRSPQPQQRLRVSRHGLGIGSGRSGRRRCSRAPTCAMHDNRRQVVTAASTRAEASDRLCSARARVLLRANRQPKQQPAAEFSVGDEAGAAAQWESGELLSSGTAEGVIHVLYERSSVGGE